MAQANRSTSEVPDKTGISSVCKTIAALNFAQRLQIDQNGIQEADGSIPFSSTTSLDFSDPLFQDPLLERRYGNDIRHRFPPWMTFRSRPCCAFATASGLV